MGYCKDCTHSFGASGEKRCYILTNSLGNYIDVDDYGSCDYFHAIPTTSNSGYKSGSSHSNSFCFLTTACVNYYNKADNCEELTLLRFFRDNFLLNKEGGAELIKNYYQIAPKIIKKIDNSNNSQSYYEFIYCQIEKCVNLIKEKKYEETLRIYITMVDKLEKEVL